MQYGLIGEHLGHSYSPEIHAQLADYEYELMELPPDKVQGFIESRNFKAINVTIPYKETVIPFLDAVDEDAKKIGAVNTVVNMDGRLYGYNTDQLGMKSLIKHMGLSLENKKVLILGTGGTAKTSRSVAESLGAANILNVSRRGGDSAISYEEAAKSHSGAEIIINATPCGMYPATEGRPLDISAFPKLEGLVDVIYHPLRTNLVLDAAERGLPASGGLYMLVAQAVYACGFFLNKRAHAEDIERIYGKILSDKQNIVLIGMPSSGKTEIGKLLAKKTGKAFIDSDTKIVETINQPIADYFAAHGEEPFRQLESAVLCDASDLSSTVIATGGGAVLRNENIRALKRNGVVVFLDRSPDKLTATPDRPLSSDKDALMNRYNERYEKYCAAADLRIDGDGSLEEVAQAVLEALKK